MDRAWPTGRRMKIVNVLPLETIANDSWVLCADPQTGAGIVALDAIIDGQRVPVMRRTPPDALPTRKVSLYSSFTLAPYSNRIRAARFTFSGREYNLRPNTPEGTAQHGDVRSRRWPVINSGAALTGSLDSREFADANYPFAYTVGIEYRLYGPDVMTALELRNVGDKPMPAGGGFHPYFARSFGAACDATLQFHAEGVYFTGPDLMPTAGMQSIPTSLSFGDGRSIGFDHFDHAYGGWDGHATLSWPGSPYRLTMTANPVFSHLVVFTAPDGSIAIEPVSHATDAINLHERGVTGTGFTVLQPGETLRGEIRYRFERS